MRAAVYIALAMVVGVAIGAGAVLLYGQWTGQQAEPSPGTAGERLGALSSFGKMLSSTGRDQVAALARLQPRGETIDLGGLMGDRLGSLLVEEGQEVKKGDVLGYLESYEERKTDLAAISTQLAEAEQQLKAETAYTDTQIQEARLGIRSAKELNPLDVRAQQAKVQLLELEVAAARRDLDRICSVSTPGTIPEQTIDQQAQLVRRYTQELNAARATLAKAQAAETLQLQQAHAKLAGAEAGLQRVKAAAKLDSLRKAQAQALVRRDRTVLRAPRDGRVLSIFCRPGERVDQKPILQLGDTRVMYAVAEVYETDIHLVKPNQKARVRSPALPAELTGTTEKIGWSVGKNELLHVDPAASADARVIKVWIRLDAQEGVEHLTNLQVDVMIDTSGSAAGPDSVGQGVRGP